MYPSGFAPARIYGTPKMHKFSSRDSLSKLRPIVSSIGTSNYDLGCFICHLLSPLVPNDYSCKDTFFFVSQVKNAYPKNYLFPTMYLISLLIFHFKKPLT